MLPGTDQVFLGTLEPVLGIPRPFLEALWLLGTLLIVLGMWDLGGSALCRGGGNSEAHFGKSLLRSTESTPAVW